MNPDSAEPRASRWPVVAAFLLRAIPVAVVLTALGLYLRLPWVNAVGLPGDMSLFTKWSRIGSELRETGQGLGLLYDRAPGCNYPPLYPTILSVLPSVYEWWHGEKGMNPQLMVKIPFSTQSPHQRAHARVSTTAQMLKMPATVADVAIIWLLLFWVWWRVGPLKGVIAALLWTVNPLSIYNSAYFGQVDAIHSLWMLVALLAAIEGWSAVAWGFTALALLTKLQAIVVVPVVAILTLRPLAVAIRDGDSSARRRELRGLLIAIVVTGAVVSGALAPFIRAGTLDRVAAVYAGSVSETRNAKTTVTGHNLWWLRLNPKKQHKGIPRDNTPFIGAFTARQVGYALFTWLTAIACLSLLSVAGRCPALLAAAVIGLGFFLVSTQMKARYGFAGVVLTIPLVTCGFRYVLVSAVLSATLLVNCAQLIGAPPGFLGIDWIVNPLADFLWSGHVIGAANLVVLGYLLFELTRAAGSARAPAVNQATGAK